MSLNTWSWKWCGVYSGRGNMQNRADGLGQKTGSKVENSENLEIYFIISGDHMFPSYFGIQEQQLFSISAYEYVQCFQNSHSS